MNRNEATQRIRKAWGDNALANSDFSFAERIALAMHALGLITLEGEPRWEPQPSAWASRRSDHPANQDIGRSISDPSGRRWSAGQNHDDDQPNGA